MLLNLGSVVFEILPIGLDEINHGATASFASHAVLGDMPPLEFTGKGPETWHIRGTLMPEFSANAGVGDGSGGLSDIDALHAMRQSGQAQPLVRGDGTPMGYVVLTRVTERSRKLNAQGIGRIIEVEIDVTATTSTPAAAAQSIIDLMPTNI
jgi:phage protein U